MKRRSFPEWFDRWMGPAFQRPPDPTVVPDGAGPMERQARRALRWYAPAWREAGERFSELMGGSYVPTDVFERARAARDAFRREHGQAQ